MTQITPEVRERIKQFIETLESGRFEQATEQLRHGERRCCLGVACDVYHEATGLGKWISENGAWYFLAASGGVRESGGLPVEVQAYFGGVTLPWGIRGIQSAASLAELNDEHGKTFAEIAQVLREEYGIDE